jgi:hypothetical protein
VLLAITGLLREGEATPIVQSRKRPLSRASLKSTHIANKNAKGGGMPISLSAEMLDMIADVSNPHMKAINEALTAEYPDNSDAAYTAMMAFQLCALLNALNPSVRLQAVDLINDLLVKSQTGYKLVVMQ